MSFLCLSSQLYVSCILCYLLGEGQTTVILIVSLLLKTFERSQLTHFCQLLTGIDSSTDRKFSNVISNGDVGGKKASILFGTKITKSQYNDAYPLTKPVSTEKGKLTFRFKV